MFSRAGKDKRRQSGPGARGAHPTPFFFFFAAFPMQPWANHCSFLSLVFPIQQLKIILSTLMLAETLSSLASKILYMKFYKVHYFFSWFTVPRTDKKRTEGKRQSLKRERKINPTFPTPSNGPAAYTPTSSSYSQRWLPQKHFSFTMHPP